MSQRRPETAHCVGSDARSNSMLACAHPNQVLGLDRWCHGRCGRRECCYCCHPSWKRDSDVMPTAFVCADCYRQGSLRPHANKTLPSLSFTHRSNPHPPPTLAWWSCYVCGCERQGRSQETSCLVDRPVSRKPKISAPLFQRDGSWDDPATLFPMSALHGC